MTMVAKLRPWHHTREKKATRLEGSEVPQNYVLLANVITSYLSEWVG